MIVLVALVSFCVRLAGETRVALDETGDWVSFDPDSLYHMRRLERALETGTVAGRDPFLAYPQELERGGQAIPWPPLYAQLSCLAARPFAPRSPAARRLFVERFVASLPCAFSVATSVLVALAAAALVGSARGAACAAAVAGCLHASSFASLRYGALGNGDHHAFVGLLQVALCWALAKALREQRASRSAWVAALSGALGGAMVACWVAGMMHLATAQIALAAALLLGGARHASALARLSRAWHAALLAVLVPFVAVSPWSPGGELAFVTLTWQQPAAIAIGALLLEGLARALVRPRAGRSLVVLLAALLAAAAGLALAPAREALGRALEWLAARGEFMRFVQESQPLAGDLAALVKYLGLGVVLLPPAYVSAARACRRSPELLPWLAAAPPLLVAALLQRRFAEAALLPAAVLLGRAAHAWTAGTLARAPRAAHIVWALCVGSALLANAETSWRTARGLPELGSIAETPERAVRRVARRSLEWLDRHAAPVDPARPEYSVLAAWGEGHAIEWIARRPSVASNFGSYLGRESYLAPWRFFLCADEARGEELLAGRGARYVYLTPRLRRDLEAMVAVLHPGEPERFLPRLGGAGWSSGLGARMLSMTGAARAREVPDDGRGIGFLRLVHVAHGRDPAEQGDDGPPPVASIWELVPGARLLAEGEPGELLAVALRLEYPAARFETVWRASAVIDAGGRALLRVPYATEAPNGEGLARDGLRWSLGARSGVAAVAERDVLEGRELSLP